MKGVILAGGSGSRMGEVTKVTNKHLLPILNKPMICYPLQTLLDAQISDVLVVSGREHLGHICEFLGSGTDRGVRFTYKVQDQAGGIAEALSLAEDYAHNTSLAVILGDNIFEQSPSKEIKDFQSGARIFLKEVEDAQRFGVADLDDKNLVRGIEEKPKNPKTNYAVTGLYLYDPSVFDIIKTIKPSGRGELEITDVNNAYIAKKTMDARFINGFWSDAGTTESWLNVNNFLRSRDYQDK